MTTPATNAHLVAVWRRLIAENAELRAKVERVESQSSMTVADLAAEREGAMRALDEHRCDQQAERAYRRAAKAEAENAELRAKVERWIDANERDCRELTELRAKVERVLLSIDRPEEDERYAAEVNDGGALMVIQAERRIARDLRRALDGEQS